MLNLAVGDVVVYSAHALAREQLRALVDESGIATIGEVLRDSPPGSGDSWLRRRRAAQATLGDATGLAEVVRGGCVRDAASARPAGAGLAPGERALVRRAWALLTAEIAPARDVPIGDAEAWVDRQLAPSG